MDGHNVEFYIFFPENHIFSIENTFSVSKNQKSCEKTVKKQQQQLWASCA